MHLWVFLYLCMYESLNWNKMHMTLQEYTSTVKEVDVEVMAKTIGALGKYDQRSLYKWIVIVNCLIFYLKNSHTYNLSLDNKNLIRGGLIMK